MEASPQALVRQGPKRVSYRAAEDCTVVVYYARRQLRLRVPESLRPLKLVTLYVVLRTVPRICRSVEPALGALQKCCKGPMP